jgi:two-component system sensor histidine kinase TctE
MAPAELAFEGMKRFTGDVAHEVRTPLQLIQGQVDVALLQPRGVEEYRHALEGVGFEARRLSHVVDGLLTLARAEAGAAGIARQPVRLDDLIFEALPAAQRLAAPGEVTVDVDVEGEGVVMGDPVLLRQALISLVDNAVRYGPQNGRIILRGSWEGGRGILEVDDQGPGIPQGEREAVLERFGGRKGEGRKGLGLSIVRWIAEAHGGDVAILDSPEGGARVRISLPPDAVDP